MSPALPKDDWHYVYLLSSKKTKWIYIGCTSNLEKRLREHSEGKVYSTKRMLPVELIYFEGYVSKECAFQREKKLKAFGSGLGRLKSRLGINREGRAG
jgi:putative endonuclease